MNQKQYTNEESEKIEAARQYLLGLADADASLATTPACTQKIQ